MAQGLLLLCGRRQTRGTGKGSSCIGLGRVADFVFVTLEGCLVKGLGGLGVVE